MKLLGVTGGIGMGKSAVEHLLQARGVPTVDTDSLARDVVQPGQPALAEIRETFGDQMVDEKGALCRERLARVVFSDADARQRLNNITHPRIRELWRIQVSRWKSDGIPLAAVVIPLLFETGAEPEFDAVVCVACSAGTQRCRLLGRGWTTQDIEQRNAAQWPIEQKMARANHVAWTEGVMDVLDEQIERLLRKFG